MGLGSVLFDIGTALRTRDKEKEPEGREGEGVFVFLHKGLLHHSLFWGGGFCSHHALKGRG